MAQEDDKELYDTSDLSDLAKISLPFKIEEVRPQCVACVRRQLKKFQNATDEHGKALKNRFIVDCSGVPKDPIDLKLKPLFSAEEWKQANELMDPVLWAQKWLTHPNGDPWVPRHYQEEVMRCSTARKALRIARRSGKCLAEGSKILTEDGPIEVEVLFKKTKKPTIVSFSETEGDLVKTGEYSIWSNGEKQTVQILTGYGKETVVTKNHPFLIILEDGTIGWREAGDLKVGDCVATPLSYEKIEFKYSDISDREARLLGYFIGDGSLNYAYSSRITNITPEVLDDFRSLISDYGCELNPLDKQSYLVVSKNKNRHVKYRNKINNLLDDNKMRKTARFKNVPERVLSGSVSAVINFLCGYWSTDGWVSAAHKLHDSAHPRQGTEVAVGSASKQLLKDVQYLLLRIGIFSNISYKKVKYKDEYLDNWTLVISSKDHVEKFLRLVAPKGKLSTDAVSAISRERGSSKAHFNFIPKQIYNYLEEQRKRIKKSKRCLGLKETGEYVRYTPQYSPTREKLSIFADNAKDEYLKWLSRNNLVWEEIVSISNAGVRQTYDINVPETSTLVADNIISHNTELVSVSITFLAATKDNQQIVVAAPQKIHAEEIFKRLRSFLYRNPLLATSVEKDISSPIYEIVLKNGSSIKGFALGTRGKTEGMSVRGSSADHIFCEEMAYIDEQAIIGGLFPILQTSGRVTFTGFGTPTGFKSIYYKICEDDPRYREFFYSYRVLPHWREVEKDKINYTESDWLHEMEAQWGFSEEGVYRPAYVDRSLRSYLYKDQSPTYGWRYSIGADWNEKHGAELVVLGQNISGNYFQVVEAVSVGSSEFTQLNGVQALVDLNKKWRPSIIYADSGNGSSNYELLRKMSYEERRKGGDPDTARLLDILRKYDSGASILSKDPVTREERKVPAKPFMVNASIRAFEQDRMRISSADKELEKQIRNYIIERISPTGTPVYGGLDGRVKDHKLDALNLAIVGFYIEFGWMKQSDPIVAALSSLSPRQKVSNNVESNRSRDLGDNRTNLQTKLESPAMELFGAHLPARVSPNQMVGSSRPGWEYDMEGIEEEKRQQRLRKKKRGRLGIRSNI